MGLEAAGRYQQAKRSAALAFTEAKTRTWEVFGEAMENDFQTASKRFWTTIRRLRRGKQCIVNTVYGGDGALLTSNRDVVDRWKEYFEDLLNPTDTASGKEAGPGASSVGSPFSGAEVAEVVRKLLSGRALGVDEVLPEFLKALDVVGLSWLTRLSGHRGQCLWIGRLGWWSLFLRRGTGGFVPTIGGSHSSAFLVRSIRWCWRGGSVG